METDDLIRALGADSRRPAMTLAAALAAAPEPERPSEREIGKALSMLAPGQRSVVAAISVEGRSIGETAVRLGMSETAVRVALHRGLAAIAKHFGQGRFGQGRLERS